MDLILNWADSNATVLFFALIVFAVAAGWLHWRGRAPWDIEAPVPLLHRHHAFLVAAITTALFAALALAIEANGSLVGFDQRAADAIHASLGQASLPVLAAITQLGGSHALVIASALVAIALMVLRHRLLAVGWIVALLGNGLLIRIGKDAFQRVRPIHDNGYIIETGYSFPSGHAAGSLMFYGMLAYVAAVLLPTRWHRPLLITAIIIVVLIGSSRVLLQVHFISDVFAGYALATGWLALCVSTIEYLRTARL